jgi:hypothetical protein
MYSVAYIRAHDPSPSRWNPRRQGSRLSPLRRLQVRKQLLPTHYSIIQGLIGLSPGSALVPSPPSLPPLMLPSLIAIILTLCLTPSLSLPSRRGSEGIPSAALWAFYECGDCPSGGHGHQGLQAGQDQVRGYFKEMLMDRRFYPYHVEATHPSPVPHLSPYILHCHLSIPRLFVKPDGAVGPLPKIA